MFENVLLVFSSIIVLVSSLAMVVTKNIMHACIFLLITLLGVAGLYAGMGAEFVAVSQVMVYVGGVVILMLFAIMLTGGKDHKSRAEQIFQMVPSMGNKKTVVVSLIISFALGVLIYLQLIRPIIATLKINKSTLNPTLDSIGKLLLTDHLLVFEFSSILLLGALIGAAIIARQGKNHK